MTNKNYVIGRQTEYKAMEELKDQGYTCFRTAGSHGLADVIAVDLNNVRFIQIKSINSKVGGKKYSWKDVKELTELSVPMGCRKELWVWNRALRKWTKEVFVE